MTERARPRRKQEGIGDTWKKSVSSYTVLAVTPRMDAGKQDMK